MIQEYSFNSPGERNGYRLFPDAMESDALFAFHGTSETAAFLILKDGFSFAGSLKSLSFAKSSPLALRYACEKRTKMSPRGCVIAVRFKTLEKPSIEVETSIIHVRALNDQPEIVGTCYVPAEYRYI